MSRAFEPGWTAGTPTSTHTRQIHCTRSRAEGDSRSAANRVRRHESRFSRHRTRSNPGGCVGVVGPTRATRLAVRRLARSPTEKGFCSVVQQCAFAPRGLNRFAVGKTAISTSGWPQPLAPPPLTSLVACTSALRRAILWLGGAWGGPRSLPSLRDGPALFPACAPCPSIQST